LITASVQFIEEEGVLAALVPAEPGFFSISFLFGMASLTALTVPRSRETSNPLSKWVFWVCGRVCGSLTKSNGL